MPVSITEKGDSTTSQELFASNPKRYGAVIHNASSADLTIAFGKDAASGSNLTAIIAGSGGYYEVPEAFATLSCQGVWASDAGGSAFVTEAFGA